MVDVSFIRETIKFVVCSSWLPLVLQREVCNRAEHFVSLVCSNSGNTIKSPRASVFHLLDQIYLSSKAGRTCCSTGSCAADNSAQGWSTCTCSIPLDTEGLEKRKKMLSLLVNAEKHGTGSQKMLPT